MTKPTVIFSHGQESGPWGTKIQRMAAAAQDYGCAVDSIDYRGIADPGERVEKLLASCAGIEKPLVLVGSSMGGHVATAAAAKLNPAGVFVLAPAFYMPGYEALTPQAPGCPLMIVHGWRDDVVPVDNSIRYAQECRATLHLLDGDHRLTENIDEIVALLLRFIATL